MPSLQLRPFRFLRRYLLASLGFLPFAAVYAYLHTTADSVWPVVDAALLLVGLILSGFIWRWDSRKRPTDGTQDVSAETEDVQVGEETGGIILPDPSYEDEWVDVDHSGNRGPRIEIWQIDDPDRDEEPRVHHPPTATVQSL